MLSLKYYDLSTELSERLSKNEFFKEEMNIEEVFSCLLMMSKMLFLQFLKMNMTPQSKKALLKKGYSERTYLTLKVLLHS